MGEKGVEYFIGKRCAKKFMREFAGRRVAATAGGGGKAKDLLAWHSIENESCCSVLCVSVAVCRKEEATAGQQAEGSSHRSSLARRPVILRVARAQHLDWIAPTLVFFHSHSFGQSLNHLQIILSILLSPTDHFIPSLLHFIPIEQTRRRANCLFWHRPSVACWKFCARLPSQLTRNDHTGLAPRPVSLTKTKHTVLSRHYGA